ncbi:MAG TPA: hypothetical protein VHF25_04970 [Nitriliruptorales bacterium]|nr:hypothetical protein [Nitriliruptorales bacterium]
MTRILDIPRQGVDAEILRLRSVEDDLQCGETNLGAVVALELGLLGFAETNGESIPNTRADEVRDLDGH